MQKAASCWFAGFCKTKPTCSHVFKQMIREWVLTNESSKHLRAYVPVMEDAACTGVRVPGRAPRKGWSGRGVLAGNMGNTLPRAQRNKSGRVSC